MKAPCGLLLVLLFFSACSSGPAALRAVASEKPGAILTLPWVADVNGLIITQLEFGKKPFLFLLDTGAGATFVDPDLVGQLPQMRRSEADDQVIASAQSKETLKAYRWTLQRDSFGFPSLLAFAQSNWRFKKDLDGVDCCHGVLGFNFLSRFAVEVDRGAKAIRIHQTAPALDPGQWMELPVEILGDKVLGVSCRSSKGGTLKLRLDTGAEVPLILQPAYTSAHRIPQKLGPLKSMPFVDMGDVVCGKLDPVKIDGLVFLGKSGALAHTFVDGNLGAAILGGHYVLDIPHKRILVERPAFHPNLKLPAIKAYDIEI